MGRLIKISKRRFYDMGGFSNPRLTRKQYKHGWIYFEVVA